MSQFTKYSSSDPSGPGQISGTAGSLLTVLDACLVNGYTGKTAAGWTKPIANSGNLGCYVQGAGSGYGLVINDNGPNGTSTFKEAWGTGWKSIAGIGAPVGSGTGQFPTAAQLLTTGHVVIRKSTTADAVGRNWVLYADSRTFYLFVLTGDTAGRYFDFHFGDIYSLWVSDTNQCTIVGRTVENSSTAGSSTGGLDRMINPLVTNPSFNKGVYIADNFAGTSGSVESYPCGDLAKATTLITASSPTPMSGRVPAPNAADNSYYLSTMNILDSSWGIRGRFRGLYHICHPVSSFTDGQVFSGANDFAGKSFVVILTGMANGMYCIETSDTLDTN